MYLDRISQHSFLPGYVSRDGVVLDLGFNHGQFSYSVIARYGSRVFAVEPVREFCDAAVPSPNLTLTNAAVLDSERTVQMLASTDKHLSATVLDHDVVATIHDVGNADVVEVRGVTLKTVIDSTGSELIDLIKMDIEGAELDVLSTIDEDALKRIKQIAIEFHDFWYPELSERTEAVKIRLQSLGFDMIRFTPNNKDVLFINIHHIKLSAWHRFYIAHVLRNINGLGRAIMIVLRKTGLAAQPKPILPKQQTSN